MTPSRTVAVIPAAGQATRLGPLTGSKELLSIGNKPVTQHLLEKLHHAGIRDALLVLRAGKWDIPAYLADGGKYGMNLSYTIARYTYGPPFSVDQAYAWVKDATVVLGFPDILFTATDAFQKVLAALSRIHCDVVLGLFPADRPDKMDMVEVDMHHRLRQLVIKPGATDLSLTWGIAAWGPAFTDFMHAHLRRLTADGATPHDVHIGHVLQAALAHGLDIQTVPVDREPYIDIGTPEDLVRARARFGA